MCVDTRYKASRKVLKNKVQYSTGKLKSFAFDNVLTKPFEKNKNKMNFTAAIQNCRSAALSGRVKQ